MPTPPLKRAALPESGRRAVPEPPRRAAAAERKHATFGQTMPMGTGVGPEPKAEATRAAAGGIELVVIDETQIPGASRKLWRAAEIWTKRRVYGLDSTFLCTEVLDRATGRAETKHDLLGARLGGGRLREKEGVRFSYPLPLPGMEAMFMKGTRYGYTSIVERMVVRIRVLETASDEVPPSWEDIAQRWSEVPPR
jgi:hypothetical protein